MLSKYLLAVELRFDLILYPKLVYNQNSDVGHIKWSHGSHLACRRQVPHHCYRVIVLALVATFTRGLFKIHIMNANLPMIDTFKNVWNAVCYYQSYHTFPKKHFPPFLNTKFKFFNTLPSSAFFEILFMEHSAKYICRIVISWKE